MADQPVVGSPGAGAPTVRILGTHGVPANYGGFETAAENVALFLARHGWRVIVYCQVDGDGPIYEDSWNGIERVNIPVATEGWRGTSKFDLLSIRHACRNRDVCLTFGYNTAIFNTLQRVRRIPNVINMDGIEWSRARWGLPRQAILYVNERIGCLLGDVLIADHPEIERHLRTRTRKAKIEMVTYGADPVVPMGTGDVTALGLEPGGYITLIARPIPENSILEIVQGFSAAKRGVRLVILGAYEPDDDDFHRQVMDAAGDEVTFVGPLYDKAKVASLRFHSLGYLHGHTVGGTNPSLVEAMAAGNPVIAHDNPYNRWVVGDGGLFFTTAAEFSERVAELLGSVELQEQMRKANVARFEDEFTWDRVAGQYEEILSRYVTR